MTAVKFLAKNHTTLLQARSWRIGEKGRETGKPKWGKNLHAGQWAAYPEKSTQLRSRKRTTVQRKLAQKKNVRFKVPSSSSMTRETLACMRKCNEAIEPKTSPSETPLST